MIAAKAAGWSTFHGRPARFVGRRTGTPAWVGSAAVLAALLVLAPMVSLLVLAAGDSGDIWPHLARYVLPNAVLQTALLLGGVAVVTVLVGVGSAWIVTTFQFAGRSAFIWLLPLPLAIPTYIVAYVYVDILDTLGPVQSALRSLFGWRSPADYWFPNVRSLGGAVFVISFVLYPYVYLAARAMMQTQSSLFMEAARVLGARPWTLARHITLPLARPAIAVGVALALLETLNDIGASEYLGVQTLTLSIFTTWLNRGSLAGAAQIACVMLLLVALLIWLERAGRRDREFSLLTQDARLPVRIVLRGWRGFAAALACFIPALLGFLLPAGFLLREVIARGLLVGFDTDLIRHTLTTLGLASAATAIVLLLGFAAVASLRYIRHPVLGICVNIAGAGYAVPGTVLALGLLAPLVLVDEGINAFLHALGGPNVGLILAGSAAALVLAYVIRFLAIAIGFAQAGFARIAPEFDEVARLFGSEPGAACPHHPSAADPARHLGRRALGLCRLPEGIARDTAVASAQCGDALDLHLSVRHARKFRGGLPGGAAHRGGRHPADHPRHPICGSRYVAPRQAALRRLTAALYPRPGHESDTDGGHWLPSTSSAIVPRHTAEKPEILVPAATGLKRLGITVAAVGAAGFGVLVGVSMLIPAETVRDAVQAEIRAVTGLDPVLRGKTSVSLFPTGTVTFEDVSLGENRTDTPALMAEQVVARLRVLPFLIGRVQIADVELVRPTIAITVAADGTSNWSRHIEMLATSLKSGAGRLASFSEIRIGDGTVIVRDDAHDLAAVLTKVEFALAWPSISRSFAAAGRFAWRGETIDATLSLNDFVAALSGERSGLKIRLAGAPIKFAFDGSVSHRPELKLDGTLAADVTSLRDTLRWAGHQAPPGGGFGRFALKAQAALSGTNVALSGSQYRTRRQCGRRRSHFRRQWAKDPARHAGGGEPRSHPLHFNRAPAHR